MLDSLDFFEVASLLNHSKSIKINTSPKKQEKGAWACYEGEYIVHGERIDFEILYLYSKITNDEIRRAERYFSKGKTRIVFPPSLDRRTQFHRKVFREAKSLSTIREYLTSFFAEELKEYNARLKERKPQHYIDPQIKVPRGAKRKIPNPLLGGLREPSEQGELIVLLAEPGQGKTYMAEYIVSALAEREEGLFPIYVNADQWLTMAPAEIGSLWKTITHSFRHLESPIGWVAGCEEEFIQTTLKAGIFCIIFDGFDEYILYNQGKIGAIEALEALSALVHQTEAPILVTSRTSFWESEVKSQIDEMEGEIFAYNEYVLCPFSPEQAKKYFQSRLDEAVVDRATNLYRTLHKSDEQFVGRGFVLSLIADLFEDKQFLGNIGAPSSLLWLIEALCRREVRRQKLPINESEQTKTLTLFAAEELQGEHPNDDLLDYCIGNIAPKLSDGARKECINNMRPHPLISYDKANELWRFKQKQVRVMVLACFLLESNIEDLKRFNERAEIDDDLIADISLNLDHLIRTRQQEVCNIINRLLEASPRACSH